jgi:hypothetical protein
MDKKMDWNFASLLLGIDLQVPKRLRAVGDVFFQSFKKLRIGSFFLELSETENISKSSINPFLILDF